MKNYYNPKDYNICERCGRRFPKQEGSYQKKYCSDECKYQYGYTVCKKCGKKFKKRSISHLFCSDICQREFRKGKAPEYKEWSLLCEIVSERDNYTCVNCGCSNNVKFVVHHKKPLVFGGDNSLENLELLCSQCHSDKHSELYDKFINKEKTA